MTTLCIVSLPVEYNLSSTASDFGKIQKRTDPESKGMSVSLCPHVDTHVHTYNMRTVIQRSPLKTCSHVNCAASPVRLGMRLTWEDTKF